MICESIRQKLRMGMTVSVEEFDTAIKPLIGAINELVDINVNMIHKWQKIRPSKVLQEDLDDIKEFMLRYGLMDKKGNKKEIA